MKYRNIITPAIALILVLFCSCKGDYSRIADTFVNLKGKREITVVMIGDSVTGADASYASLLKKKFTDFLGARVSLINSSRPSLTFDQALRFYQEDVLSFRPDVVFVMLGMVDASAETMYFYTFQNAVSTYFDLLRKEDTLVIVLTPTGCKERGQAFDFQERLGEFSEEIIRQARLHHFPVIDIAGQMENLWSDHPGQYQRMFSDMVLLNDQGSEFVADYIVSTIRRTVDHAGGH